MREKGELTLDVVDQGVTGFQGAQVLIRICHNYRLVQSRVLLLLLLLWMLTKRS